MTSITYPSPRLRKEFERAETLADAANARITKRDIVFTNGRRARRKTLKLEGGDSWHGTWVKHLDEKWAL